MEIIDRYGYLKGALSYIEQHFVSGLGLHKIAIKTGVKEGLLKNLSLSLKNFSEKDFLTILHEKIAEKNSFLSGAFTEISEIDVSIEKIKNKAYISINLVCDIVVDNDKEDQLNLDIKIFSKNNIQIS